MSSLVSIDKQGTIAVIRIDNPPVNALSQPVRQGILDAVIAAEADPEVRAVVLACAGKTFVAGADIAEMDHPPLAPHLPDVLQRLDQCVKPVIAALFGTVLGGGFELALSCHYRIALQGTKVGLPEVNLGLIPGAGGTQLLPRIAGVEVALDMITSGKPVAVEEVPGQGVADWIVTENLLQAALVFATSLLDQGVKPQPVSALQIEKSEQHDELFAAWRAKLAKKNRGQIAPQYCVDSVENAVLLSFAEGLRRERKMFLECRDSPQSRAMRHAFVAERQCAKLVNVDATVAPMPVNSVGIIGAGTMGGGIAICFASAGIPVVLLEMNEENLQRGLQTIRNRYQQNVDKGRISIQQSEAALSRIKGSCEYADLAGVDLVVEAAFENMAIKQQIFARLDEVCKPDAILASNTSYLDLNTIADATERSANIVGMHFFSPANVMKLLEVVRTAQTSDRTLLTAMAVGKRIGKIAVAVGVCYGFVGNRMYSCYGREAQMLLLEGATPQQIDSAMEAWGMAMGPLAVSDLSGIDIGYKARRENPDAPDDPCYFRPADLMVEEGRLGQKNGQGFYRYDQSGSRIVDEQVTAMIRAEAIKLGVAQRDEIDEEEIQSRLLYALINEGARIVEEGIASRASDIDVIWLNGYGFPRFRGGPMCYADEVGLDKVLQGIAAFAERLGGRYWEPSALLQVLAAEKKSLKDYVAQ